MFGAVYGDVIGSYYEIHSTKNYDFPLERDSAFTDDSVMTAAVCRAILDDPREITRFAAKSRGFEYAVQYKQFYSYYPNAGYGQMFSEWACSDGIFRQRSYGNGGAMRVVPIGWAYGSLEQVLLQAKASCMNTHCHPKAIKGAQAVAAAVFLARNRAPKPEIRELLEKKFGYELGKTPDEIRPGYKFDSSADYSVPPAIMCFLCSEDYESAVRNAVSLGGDADTMGCIAGGIA